MHQTTKTRVKKRHPITEFNKILKEVDRTTEAEVVEDQITPTDSYVRFAKGLGILQPSATSDLIKTSLQINKTTILKGETTQM